MKNNNKGMTFSELLVATLIVLLVSLGLTTGVALANKQFVSSIRQSEAHELYSTLSSLINNELRFIRVAQYKGDGTLKDVTILQLPTYGDLGQFVYLDEDGAVINDGVSDVGEMKYGQLAFGSSTKYTRLLGSASYPNDLGAKVIIQYDELLNIFKVTLDIGTNDYGCILLKTFDVRPLNNVVFTGS